MSGLAPCPFCGQTPQLRHVPAERINGEMMPDDWYVYCENCLFAHPNNWQAVKSAEEAVERWNRRPGEDSLKAGHADYCAERERRIAALETQLEQAQERLAALPGIVDQLAACDYQCEAGPLANNVEFQRLAQLARLTSQGASQ